MSVMARGWSKNMTHDMKETIDEKFSWKDRLKYAAVPALVTVVSSFGPEIKQHYDALSEEQKNQYRRIGAAFFGGVVAGSGIYAFYPRGNDVSE